jgi:tetratricopeptide (TPR) repeat protein
MHSSVKLAAVAVVAAGILAGQIPAPSSSPAQKRVDVAEKRTKAEPQSWQAYNDLAFAYCRWARDAEDAQLYDKAESALQHSFQLSPGNYEARKLEIQVILGKHDFARGLKLATELNHQVPDDIAGWALLVDANVGLKNYDAAEHAAQWILDLRAGSSLGFVKAAGLREIFGDPEGAAEFFEEASKRTAQSDLDERAWLLTQNARQQLKLGKPERAEDTLKQALQLFPDSHLALAEMAAVHGSQAASSQKSGLQAEQVGGQVRP